MRNFFKLAEGVNVLPVLNQLAWQPDLWNQNPFRSQFEGTPHVDVEDILLRFSGPETLQKGVEAFQDDGRPVWYPGMGKLQAIKPLVLDLMRFTNAYELDRLIVTRVNPGGRILPHSDNVGDYVNAGDIARYHIVLQGLPGSLFHCGDETVNMRTGEIWWFNAFDLHSVENNSKEDRIHLLVDMRIMP